LRNLAAKILCNKNEEEKELFCYSKSKVRQNVNRHDCVVRSKGDFFRSRSEGRYVVWLLVSCSRSLFSGIVTRCANTGFLRITIPRIPAFVDACVRAYVSITSISPAWTTSIGSDRFSHSSLSLFLLHYARDLSHFNVQLRYAIIIRRDRTQQNRLIRAISRRLTDSLPSKFIYTQRLTPFATSVLSSTTASISVLL